MLHLATHTNDVPVFYCFPVLRFPVPRFQSPRSNFRVLLTIRAAEFMTRCNLSVAAFGAPASRKYLVNACWR